MANSPMSCSMSSCHHTSSEALATGSAWMDGLSRLTHVVSTTSAGDSLDQVSHLVSILRFGAIWKFLFLSFFGPDIKSNQIYEALVLTSNPLPQHFPTVAGEVGIGDACWFRQGFNTVGSSLCGGQWAISLSLLGVACIASVQLDIIGRARWLPHSPRHPTTMVGCRRTLSQVSVQPARLATVDGEAPCSC